jgi:hypothetical protein
VLIEKERDPFVNKRVKYADATLSRDIVDALVRGDRAWKERFSSAVNRAKYEHNRKLECRKTVEHGLRLRGLNSSQRTIVWTIEKIPWVYDKG